MAVLIGYECTGAVRDAMLAVGVDAVSCDLLPTRRPGPHIQGDIRDAIRSRHWDGLIAFPPCTYLCSSGLHWNKRRPERALLTEEALETVRYLLGLDIDRIGLENPGGCISTRIRPPDQRVHPHWFGDDASKETCLWLKNLPPLEPTEHVPPRIVNGKPRWANQTDSGQNRLGPSADRWLLRSATYPGVAKAMARFWGPLFGQPVTPAQPLQPELFQA